MTERLTLKVDVLGEHEHITVTCHSCPFMMESADREAGSRHARNNPGHTVLISCMSNSVVHVTAVAAPEPPPIPAQNGAPLSRWVRG